MVFTTLSDYLHWAEEELNHAPVYFGHGTDNAWDEAVALARYILKFPPEVDRSVLTQKLSESESHQLKELTERRIRDRIPVPYLTHEAYFAGLKFYVDERVIIPRSPFGELILKRFQPWFQPGKGLKALDLCTGSGCMAIATALQFENSSIDAVDISKDALAVAQINVKLHECENRVRLIEADLFSGCGEAKYDIIMSNPPYVPKRSYHNLPKEYTWEPKGALEAGVDGLEILDRILKEAPQYLKQNGLLFIELGEAEKAFRKKYPKLPVEWIQFEEGGEGVFVLKGSEKSCWQIS